MTISGLYEIWRHKYGFGGMGFPCPWSYAATRSFRNRLLGRVETDCEEEPKEYGDTSCAW